MFLNRFQLDGKKRSHLWFFFICCGVTILFTSGIVFGKSFCFSIFHSKIAFQILFKILKLFLKKGWAAILLVFLKEGQYSEYCVEENGVLNVSIFSNQNFQTIPKYSNFKCDQQDLKLNLIFTISSIMIVVASPILGTVVDKLGSRISLLICSVSLVIGFTLAGFSDSKTFDAWIPAFLFITFGTSGFFFLEII